MVFNSEHAVSMIQTKKSIFLAGSMDLSKKVSWRKKVTLGVNGYDLFDPTINNHDFLSKDEMDSHVNWELDAMSKSTLVLFNFLGGSFSPISLLELGLNCKSKKALVVCERGFYKYNYVQTLCVKYNIPFFETLTDVINNLNK